MKKYHLFILSILGFLTYTSSFSQEVKVKATIDSTKILVGDQVNMKIQISYPAKTIISWPTFKDSLNKHIEIIEQSKIDTLLNDLKSLTLQQTLTITSFDSGSFYVPSVLFKYKNLNAEKQMIEQALKTSQSLSAAARSLEMKRSTLRDKIKKYGIILSKEEQFNEEMVYE